VSEIKTPPANQNYRKGWERIWDDKTEQQGKNEGDGEASRGPDSDDNEGAGGSKQESGKTGGA
jgi:hypothetical protein